MEYWDLYDEPQERPPDPAEERARIDVVRLFTEQAERVFFSRQVEVHFETQYFHWITNRVLRHLEEEGFLKSADEELAFGGGIKLYWNSRYRYYKRDAKRVVDLVGRYSEPAISGALGHHAELMIVEAFARNGFVLLGRNTRSLEGIHWRQTDHDLDLIVARDGEAYGIEVKNTLGYMDQEEFRIKRDLCAHLGIRPVFAVRMMPRTWAAELIEEGGYAMILKWQLYPVANKDLARLISKELGLPVDAPRAIAQGTMDKFLGVHQRRLGV